jgi:hypothetical protein
VQELQDERLWEEYSEISFHKELFNVACLLHMAFPKRFPEPDIVQIKMNLTALNPSSIINLKELKPSFLVRLLNDGMDDHSIIYRLFDEQLFANSFPESEYIIWKVDNHGYDEQNQTVMLDIYTSWNWVDELKGITHYESTSFADGQLK